MSGHPIVPLPVSLEPVPGVTFTLAPDAAIASDSPAAGAYLAALLRPPTGYALPVTDRSGTGIALRLAPDVEHDEGYELEAAQRLVTVRARTEAGLLHGVQTLRQLLPAAVESRTVRSGPWTVPGVRIADHPRYAYRGAMLDVSRHFFGVEVLERFVEQIARYKLNVLHLHLSDDQGWRIAVDAWPRLTAVGGATQVGGGPGGYYTKAQYAGLVAYAAARHVTVVPEIDMPGHTNAALTAYPQLNAGGVAPPPYTGTDVGFSTLAVGQDVTYTFVRQVLHEIAALTPGPYLHLGGDEALSTTVDDYRTFLNRVQPYVAEAGKTVIGWHQIGPADHTPGRVAQYWATAPDDDVRAAIAQGDRILLSPADRVYLDMKYTVDSRIGLDWAGPVEVDRAYDWDPATLLPGADILGLEAPLWTETVATVADIDYLTFPRLPAVAEVAWSPQSARTFADFAARLATHGPRWTLQGVDFHRSPKVPWD